MLKNYLKTTLRNLWKHRTFSLLNIAGLATGIACAALILIWVEDEYHFGLQFEKRDFLYRIIENQTNDGKIATSFGTPSLMAPAVKEEIPGIKNAGRVSWGMDQVMARGDKSVKSFGIYMDSSVLSMLTMKFIHGDLNDNPAAAFRQEQSVIISETLSKSMFGDANPVGMTIEMKGKEAFSGDGLFIITGVYKDFGAHSSLDNEYQWISPYTVFEKKNSWMKTWNNDLAGTLVELEPSADPSTVNKRLAGYLGAKRTGVAPQCFLFAMKDWHLRNHFSDGRQEGGLIRYVKLFSLIAGIILLIACINFMNLATARSEQRAREVGVRKVMGATRGSLITRFAGESLVMSMLAVLLAIALVYAALPAFNTLLGTSLTFAPFQPLHLAGLLTIGMVTGLVAGSYPAFYLSSFQPVSVLKGLKTVAGAGVVMLRKGLVVTQFGVSIVFIISTVIVYQQLQHLRQRDLGYDKDRLIYITFQGNILQHFRAMHDQLLSSGVVENASLSLHEPLHVYGATYDFNWQGKDPHKRISINVNQVSPEYLSTMQMKLMQGRDFYASGSDSNNIIVNEAMARLMGRAGKAGARVTAFGSQFQVIGVIKDFVYNDMSGPAGPLILFCYTPQATALEIRLKPGIDIGRALAGAEKVYKAVNPGYPFDYHFVDQDFAQQFQTETFIGSLARIFAILAIFISCLGLFGLAAYTAERRTKEIGIRKVLGASISGMAALLSKDFLRLVAFSCLIAFPIAWWAMHNWLAEYAYRTTIDWWVFAGAGLGALAIALVTVSFQAIRAALVNPVKSLRTE